MTIIRARRDDWVPANPRIHAGGWIGAILLTAAVYIAIAAVIGHFINGSGSPLLGS